MTELLLDPAGAGFLVAFVLHAGFGLHLLSRSQRSSDARAHWAFIAAVGITCAWAAASLADLVFRHSALPLLAATLDLLRYGAWFAFLLLVIRPTRPGRSGELRALPAVAAALLAFGALAMLLSALAGDSGSGPRLVQFAALGLPLMGLLLVEQLFRNLGEDARWNAKPLCLGLAVVFAFDLYIASEAVLFGSYDRDALSVRGAVQSLALPLLVLASRRHANWVAKLQVSRSAAFYSATLLLAGLYLLFIAGVGYYVRVFGGGWGRALQLGLLVAAAIVLLLLMFSGSLRSKLRVFLGKNFFRYRYDYREEWLRFTATLSAGASPQEMGALAVRGLAQMVESPGGMLWARLPGEADLVATSRWNMPELALRLAPDGPLVRFLMESQWIVDLKELREHPERYPGLVVPTELLECEPAWVVVPLIVRDALTGLAVLARPRTPLALDWEVRDLLKTASRQAAVFLDQMQATEALLEARKFEAFNRMSAFVVHDLKNIVTQLTLMVKNAKRLHDNPEFQRDMMITVESSLEKMRQLMLQLREGEKPTGTLLGVDLGAVAQRISRVAEQRGRRLDLEVKERVATRGHEDRMERVLGHIVQNAFDATPADGRVWLRLSRESGRARVEVGDTGQGMTREFIETRLFRPFHTTKQGGMGIGTYESWQYVRELGGGITVDSEPGRGTLITVDLPLLDVRHGSDLQASPAA